MKKIGCECDWHWHSSILAVKRTNSFEKIGSKFYCQEEGIARYCLGWPRGNFPRKTMSRKKLRNWLERSERHSWKREKQTVCCLYVVGNVQLNLCINEYHAKRRGILSLAMERVTYSHSIMLFSVGLKSDIIDAEIIIEWFSIKKAFIMQSQNLSKHTKLSTLEQGSAIWSGYQSYNVIMELLSNYANVKSTIHGRCSGLIKKKGSKIGVLIPCPDADFEIPSSGLLKNLKGVSRRLLTPH